MKLCSTLRNIATLPNSLLPAVLEDGLGGAGPHALEDGGQRDVVAAHGAPHAALHHLATGGVVFSPVANQETECF